MTDWRILAMQELEKKIVCSACYYHIYGYDAEDLAQELRLHLWKKLHTWKKKSSIKTWAERVIRNYLYNLHKSMTQTQKRKDHLCVSLDNLQNCL
jgi:RNA polymerase sigma factor (sigma-70 family)